MKKHNIPKQFVRASIDKGTINNEAKTFEVVFATETAVFRRGWEENFMEVLVCAKENIRTERMDGGVVALLDNHNSYSGVTKQYGVLISYEIKKGELRGVIQFSADPAHDGVWKNIEAGVIRGISAGYIPWVYQRNIGKDEKIPTYRAIDWEVTEISMAPVPLDYNSKVRSEDATNYEIEIQNFNNENTRSKKMEEITEVVETPTKETQERSKETTTTPAKVVKVDTQKIHTDAVTAERTRAKDIRTAVRNAKLSDEFATELIDNGTEISEARKLIIDKMAETDTTPAVRNANAGVTAAGDEKKNTILAMSDALAHRANPGSVKLEGKAHDFKHMSMLEMGRHLLTLNGDNGHSYSPNEAVKRAIATTDYPSLLNSTVERTIRRTYEALPAEWQMIANRTTAKDFREKTGIAIDGKVTFEEVAEGGEYKNSVLITDDSAKIKLKTYGRIIRITRQAIINDDLAVFSKLPKMIAQGASNFQADMVWALITGNKKTPDNKALFHTDHGNLAGAGAAISETTLNAARVAMFRTKSPAGEIMPVTPKFLVIPPELEMVAKKILTSVLASAGNDVNTMANAFQIMSNPRLTNATEWYLAADPSTIEGLVYAYLEGEEGLFIDKETDFANDTVTTKARMDFACAAWDYRGWYKNPGA